MLQESGAKVKQERKNYVMDFHEITWSSTDIDPISITCPECNNAFEFGAWTLINAEENPEAVPKIIDGSICDFICPHCGYEAHLAHPCLFIDPARRICIYSVVDKGMAAHAQEIFSDPGNKAAVASTCRIVRNRLDLAEKVLIFTSGMDDRPIELLKFGIRGSLKMQGLAGVDDDVDVRLVGFDGSTTLSFSITCGDDSFSSDMELGAVELFTNALSKTSIVNEQPLFVDRAWGEYALDVIEAEGTMD